MASNAGIKRNRRPHGEIAIRAEIQLASETRDAINAARKASGDLSLSLYIERLVYMLETEQGSLPILTLRAPNVEVHKTAAA